MRFLFGDSCFVVEVILKMLRVKNNKKERVLRERKGKRDKGLGYFSLFSKNKFNQFPVKEGKLDLERTNKEKERKKKVVDKRREERKK